MFLQLLLCCVDVIVVVPSSCKKIDIYLHILFRFKERLGELCARSLDILCVWDCCGCYIRHTHTAHNWRTLIVAPLVKEHTIVHRRIYTEEQGWAPRSVPFGTFRSFPFFSILLKERSVLFRYFFECLATYETQKNVPFFS